MPGNSAFQGPRWRLICAITGTSLAIISVLVLDLWNSRKQALERAWEGSEAIGRFLSGSLDGLVHGADCALISIGDRISTMSLAGENASASQSNPKLDLFLESTHALIPLVASFEIIDPEGRLISSSPPILGGDAERSYIDPFVADAGLKDLDLAGYGEPALVRAKAVRDAKGSLIAVIAARIDSSGVRRELESHDFDGDRIIVVSDPELRPMARKPEAEGRVKTEAFDLEMTRLLGTLKEGATSASAVRSAKGRYLFSARVSGSLFYVTVGVASTGITLEWRIRIAIYGAILAAILTLMFLLMRHADGNYSKNAQLAARLVAMESASDMIVIADLEGKAEYVNPCFERTTGLSKDQAIGSRQAIFGRDEAHAEAALSAAAAGESWRGEIAALRADGVELIEEVTVAPVLGSEGEPVRIVAVLRDVTERRRLQERLERLAHYDSLTALPNRALFFDRLNGAVARARREERRFALLFIDLDGFKAVNDRFGHDAGDYLLFEIAARLKASIRDSDTAGRMGGDEFTVLLDNISKPEDAAIVAQKIRASLTESLEIPNGSLVTVGASIGLAVFPDDGIDGDTVLKAADSAMYAIKLANGRR
jgi:diguanylate cyclase (GGDEF)-like protein/PAS domain S-box-containing protein